MVGISLKERNKLLMSSLREAFAKGDWPNTSSIYKELQQVRGEGLSVEATCLAARALMAQKMRSQARSLLKGVGETEHSKAIHYDALARAYLDLRNYEQVARCCQRAEELAQEGRKRTATAAETE